MHCFGLNDPALNRLLLAVNSALWPTLGFVRFLLALIVAGGHLAWFTEKGDLVAELKQFSPLVAVMSFLFLSGYSIAASYERDNAQFYFRRALRILPLYVPVVVASACLPIFYPGGVLGLEAPSYYQTVLNLCFAQGFIFPSIDSNPVVWTLSLEVFFYLVAPLLARASNRTLLVLSCVSALAYINVGSFMFVHHPSAMWGLNALLLGWAWILGFWVYRARGNSASIALAIGFVAVSLQHTGIQKWWIFTWALPFAALIFSERITLRPAARKSFLFLGDVSYPLYLVHFPLYALLGALDFPKVGALFIMCALLAATILDLAYDKPAKRLILALAARRSRTPEVEMASANRPEALAVD